MNNKERCLEILKSLQGIYKCFCCKNVITIEQVNNNEIIYIGGMTDDIFHCKCATELFKNRL